jgi:hypothetical protein
VQKARKRGMSVKRRHQRIHTGVKMIGVKQLDDLFKNAVVPLAECIQLRNGLETAVVSSVIWCTSTCADRMARGVRREQHKHGTTSIASVAQSCAYSRFDGGRATDQ